MHAHHHYGPPLVPAFGVRPGPYAGFGGWRGFGASEGRSIVQILGSAGLDALLAEVRAEASKGAQAAVKPLVTTAYAVGGLGVLLGIAALAVALKKR